MPPPATKQTPTKPSKKENKSPAGKKDKDKDKVDGSGHHKEKKSSSGHHGHHKSKKSHKEKHKDKVRIVLLEHWASKLGGKNCTISLEYGPNF